MGLAEKKVDAETFGPCWGFEPTLSFTIGIRKYGAEYLKEL